MCLVPLECVCLFCKFGAFSEILGIEISKFSRGSMPPDPPRNRSAKLIAILPRLKSYPGYGPLCVFRFGALGSSKENSTTQNWSILLVRNIGRRNEGMPLENV